MRKSLLRIFSVVTVVVFIASNHPSLLVYAQDESTNENVEKPQQNMNLVTGEVRSIDTKNLTRIAVANPDIVDISDAKSEKVIIAGKKAGQTELFVWDSEGKHSYLIRVAVEKLGTTKARLAEVINKGNIKGVGLDENEYEGKVVLYGAIPKVDKDRLDKIMDPYQDKIINLVQVEVVDDLIQIDMQVTELSTTLTKQLGLDWSAGGSSSSSSSLGSSGNTTNTASSGNGLNLSYAESGLQKKAGGKLFNVASFGRTTPITVAVNALIQEGKGRILSNPRLVVLSGKEASFLVGGETPIRTTTVNSTGGQSQDNVTFKQYGVNMTITPTIREGKVDILLNVHISDIDKSTTNPQGDTGFITREAQTQLFLDDKQTIVLAGFIKHAEGETVSGIPFLSKMPVFGGLFRTRNSANPNSETEMVITLTPTILKSSKKATEQVALPSKRMVNFSKEVQGSFEKESLSNGSERIVAPVLPVVVEKKITSSKVVMSKTVISQNVSDPAVLSYMRYIQLRISQAITYPYKALQQNWEGTVKLRLRILRNGTLADCDLLQSSGHDVFDSDAINTTKVAAPFTAFPSEMKQDDLVVTVPIVYNKRLVYNKGSKEVVDIY
ncbi:MAG: TonB family protein [Candidatus Omnitrophica bacterium]|nr:TonB family protein [Candidatus Omnitrophota bacterium]